MNKKIAVIFGVTGQDGSYLSEILLEKGYRVIGVVRRVSTTNTQRLTHLTPNPDFSFATGDVTDLVSIINVLQTYKPHHVYNLAAQSHVKVSFDQPLLTWNITAGGAINILEAIRLVDSKIRFYQASSSEMYGDQFQIDANGEYYQDENTPFNPRSPYSVAKLAAHNFTKLYRDCYGLHASSGILYNHESSRRGEYFVTRKITKYVGKFKRKFIDYRLTGQTKQEALKSMELEPKLELGNLDAFRDWGHAKDFCRAMVMMLEQDSPDDYVVSTQESYSVRNFLDFAFKYIEVDDWTNFITINPAFFRPSEVPYLRGISAKARKVLGWSPEYTFKELVEEMVECDILDEQAF